MGISEAFTINRLPYPSQLKKQFITCNEIAVDQSPFNFSSIFEWIPEPAATIESGAER
jgi:hypothetical protein